MSIILRFIFCIFTDFIVYSDEGDEIIRNVDGQVSSRGRSITQRSSYRPSFGSGGYLDGEDSD